MIVNEYCLFFKKNIRNHSRRTCSNCRKIYQRNYRLKIKKIIDIYKNNLKKRSESGA